MINSNTQIREEQKSSNVGKTLMAEKSVYENVLECIGNTPLIRINRLNPNLGVTIYAKWEAKNPGGSIKDRPALMMIEDAERRGVLTKDKIIIEATSGNTGIGLAIVSAVKEYRLILAMPETASIERQKILRALGAELLLTPGSLGTDGAIEEAYRLVRENPDLYFMPDQFNNPANPLAHYLGTGPEIYEQTGGKVNVVVVTLGTGGTAMGILRALKERDSNIEVVAVEPYPGHKIQGLKNMKESYVPGIFDRHVFDRIVHVRDEDAFEMARRLARREGIFAGMSSGAAIAAAVQIAGEREDGIIVAVLPDGGDRYLSTNLFTVMLEPDFEFFDYANRTILRLRPAEEGRIRLFITGPPLDVPLTLHESRRFFLADLIMRFFEAKKFSVVSVVTIPDLDSRTIQASGRAGKDLIPYVRERLEELIHLFEHFHIHRANHYARISEYESAIIANTQSLIDRRVAYEKLRSVYFNISACDGYGKLAGIDPKSTVPGKSVDVSLYEKQNPRDFALLKRATLDELKRGLYFKTSWGNMIPTWHIAAVSVALSQWEPPVDIYLSSVDFLFPHLENVRVIGEALKGVPLAQVWLLCERVWVSRDCGEDEFCEGTSLEDLLSEGYSPEEIRYWIISTHYRRPLHAYRKNLENSLQGYRRIKRFLARLHTCSIDSDSHDSGIVERAYQMEREFFDALAQDLDCPKALAAVFSFVRDANRLIDSTTISWQERNVALDVFRKIDRILAVFSRDIEPPTEEELRILEEREKARKEGRWKVADELREKLYSQGIIVIDTPHGSHWERI